MSGASGSWDTKPSLWDGVVALWNGATNVVSDAVDSVTTTATNNMLLTGAGWSMDEIVINGIDRTAENAQLAAEIQRKKMLKAGLAVVGIGVALYIGHRFYKKL